MPLLLVTLLFLASVVLLVVRRGREELLVCAMFGSLVIYWLGILMFIAKRGGTGDALDALLFLGAPLRNALRGASLTLGTQGLIVAVGRYLFPPLLLTLAVRNSMNPGMGPVRGRVLALWPLPLLTLIIYEPAVFYALAGGRPEVQWFLVNFSRIWVLCYVAAAVALLLYEAFSITMRICRQQYIPQCAMLVSMAVLYALYCPQDPAQIYLFYQSDYMWYLGLWYLNPRLSPLLYTLVLTVSAVSGAVGLWTMFRYAQLRISENMDEVSLRRRFDAASMGASVFAHSIKNQLLANRVVFKRLDAALAQPQPDMAKVQGYVDALKETNENLLVRVGELYQSVKSSTITLVPVTLGELAADAVDRMHRKHPDAAVEITVDEGCRVLADRSHLAAALSNLLSNGWEATLSAGRTDPVQLISHAERLNIVLEVRDAGCGISRAETKRIFEPFYSSKNSNYNWGMGLYYVRSIVRSHLGSVRVESERGKGTRFFVILPRFEHGKRKEKRP